MSAEDAERAANNIIKNKLSVKELSGLSRSKKTSSKNIKKTKDTDLLNVEEEMSEGFGHKVEIEAKNKKTVLKFVNSLKLFGYGYSWGGFESLALHQNLREQGNRSYLKLAKNEHLVRLHVGLEDPEDLIADIKQSMKHIK
jgi:cystathionine beta-lyase/cystathionine gamma-synthase